MGRAIHLTSRNVCLKATTITPVSISPDANRRSIKTAAIRRDAPEPSASNLETDDIARSASTGGNAATRQFTGAVVVRVDTGEDVPLNDQLLVGRDPHASELGLENTSELTLEDRDGLVSRNHALIVRDGSFIRVFDLQSTNGTVVVREGVEYRVTDGELVGVGDRIEIGLRTLSLHVC